MATFALDWLSSLRIGAPQQEVDPSMATAKQINRPDIQVAVLAETNVGLMPIEGASLAVYYTCAAGDKYAATELYNSGSSKWTLPASSMMADMENKHCGVVLALEFDGCDTDLKETIGIPTFGKKVQMGAVYVSIAEWVGDTAKDYKTCRRVENSGLELTVRVSKPNGGAMNHEETLQTLSAQEIYLDAAAKLWAECAQKRNSIKDGMLNKEASELKMPFTMPCSRSFLMQNDDTQIRLMMQRMVDHNPGRYMHEFLPTVFRMMAVDVVDPKTFTDRFLCELKKDQAARNLYCFDSGAAAGLVLQPNKDGSMSMCVGLKMNKNGEQHQVFGGVASPMERQCGQDFMRMLPTLEKQSPLTTVQKNMAIGIATGRLFRCDCEDGGYLHSETVMSMIRYAQDAALCEKDVRLAMSAGNYGPADDQLVTNLVQHIQMVGKTAAKIKYGFGCGLASNFNPIPTPDNPHKNFVMEKKCTAKQAMQIVCNALNAQELCGHAFAVSVETPTAGQKFEMDIDKKSRTQIQSLWKQTFKEPRSGIKAKLQCKLYKNAQIKVKEQTSVVNEEPLTTQQKATELQKKVQLNLSVQNEGAEKRANLPAMQMGCACNIYSGQLSQFAAAYGLTAAPVPLNTDVGKGVDHPPCFVHAFFFTSFGSLLATDAGQRGGEPKDVIASAYPLASARHFINGTQDLHVVETGYLQCEKEIVDVVVKSLLPCCCPDLKHQTTYLKQAGPLCNPPSWPVFDADLKQEKVCIICESLTDITDPNFATKELAARTAKAQQIANSVICDGGTALTVEVEHISPLRFGLWFPMLTVH